MKKNTYSLLFGKEPLESISRAAQTEKVIADFSDELSLQQIYLITGIRGAGKTVFMTEISKSLCKDKNWICVELNSGGDLLNDLAASLASENQLAQIFKNASINLSFFGIGLEVKEVVPITNIQVAITKMLESLKKHKKRVLVCIDEVIGTQNMKLFASAFQIFVRQDLPIYLLMTGLYDNINNLQNEKNLTFLYRTPKIDLKPLNIRTMAENYQKVLNVDEAISLEMARLTKGYPFAFQVLGHFTWNHNGNYKAAIPEFRQYLEDYVYDKIWSELSGSDKKFLISVVKSGTGRAKDIKKLLSMADNEYSPYRDRLVKRGILNGDEHGIVKFTLPLFNDYVSLKDEG